MQIKVIYFKKLFPKKDPALNLLVYLKNYS